MWNDVVEVEIATFEWVSWWNESRLHQSLGYRTPIEVEVGFWEQDESREVMENKVNAYDISMSLANFNLVHDEKSYQVKLVGLTVVP